MSTKPLYFNDLVGGTGVPALATSTAFVGQVSAASSPAIAKLKGRARATNDPAYVPLASSHRAQSRRRTPYLCLPIVNSQRW